MNSLPLSHQGSTYIHMYIYILNKYVFTFIHTYIYIHKYIFIYTYVCINLCINESVCVWMYIDIVLELFDIEEKFRKCSGSEVNSKEQHPWGPALPPSWSPFCPPPRSSHTPLLPYPELPGTSPRVAALRADSVWSSESLPPGRLSRLAPPAQLSTFPVWAQGGTTRGS